MPGFSRRTQAILRTAAASYASRLISVVVVLWTIPMARATMEPDRFGLWMMLGSLVAFLSFADLGVGNGVLSRLTQALQTGEPKEAGRVMVAGYVCSLLAALALVLAWCLWLATATDPLAFAGSVSEPLRREATLAFTVFVLLAASNIALQLCQRFQLAHQDGHWLGIAQLVSSAGTLATVVPALQAGASLSVLLLCTLGIQAAVFMGSSLWWISKRRLWGVFLRPSTTRWHVGGVFRRGGLFFVLQLCAGFAFQSDAFVISRLVGQAEYGDFAAIQRVFQSLSGVMAGALVGLWPAFGDALGKDDLPWVRRALAKALLITVGSTVLLAGALVLAMPWLSAHWLGMQHAPSLALPLAFAAWAAIESAGLVTANLLNGAGIVRAQLLIALAMAACSFAAKWWFVAQVGPWGAVAATIVAYVLISAPAQAWLLRELLFRPSSGSSGQRR